LTATPGNAQVVLAWTAPASNGGSAILDYTASTAPGGATCTSATTGCTISGLTNGTPYTFTVTARNAIGAGIASSAASATPATVPGAPNLTTATAGNATADLAWTTPASNGGSAITGYAIYRGTNGGAKSLLTTLGAVLLYSDTGLANGTTYDYEIAAINAKGESAHSNARSATPVAGPTVPDAPTGLTATPGNAQVVLAWTAPASNGGTAITGYRLYRGTSSANKSLITTTGPGVTGYTDTGRSNGTTYYYQVSAVNAIGQGARSNEASAKPATVPSAPRTVTAKPNKTRGIDLTWSAPTYTNGSPITGYRIYRSTAVGGETFLVAVGTGRTYTDAENAPGTRYYYRLTATNAAGEGPLSAESSAVAK
jgi:fibronectin type 3 domain-containing protein